MEHLISIIIPVFNVEDYIEACVSSILSQTYTNFEIILVNDGSTDMSGEICNQLALKDRRIKVIHQVNGGVSAARNAGIEVSKGKYICFIDSDDSVCQNFLEGFNFDFDISIQGYVVKNKNNNIYVKYNKLSSNNLQDVPKVYCLNGIHSGPVSKLCRSEIIKENNIRFPEGISFSEDTIFFLKYIKYCKSIYVSDQCGYIYRKREESLSTTHYSIDKLMEKERILFNLYNDLFDNGRFKDRFFHELSLFVISKYYFNEGIRTIQSLCLEDIGEENLNSFEKKLLTINYALFSYYALWRRRFKRRILRPLFNHYETTLLNL